ncbi:MAG: AbrB/MazE/SpoVT family DNA-binding domain-containing protein [Gammaproteobacteria bacterium]|nr:AbrB/MazE/SpoVT family DNA-binding domain-containing protein [Gammaproteobacteria bacterium]MDP2142190.1 AbrB/MazE/SpoVT family DNA-binding domain-containing protein [Gammaproteobacteria bacterium]MDP2348200.1 AbrB/MazE/SpoVT family DNA-binding domain-containing protein [Gammaproteobacteria bacterium]
MSSATVSSKSQITIPASVRSALKIGPGDRIDFIQTAADRFEVVAATQEVTRLRGMVEARRVVTIEEMDSAIRAKAGKA